MKLLMLGVIAFSLFFMSGCKKKTEELELDYELVLNKKKLVGFVGTELSCTAKLMNSAGQEKAVQGLVWTSSDNQVARIKTNGTIELLSIGDTNLEAVVVYGGKTLSTVVEVRVLDTNLFSTNYSSITTYPNAQEIQLENHYSSDTDLVFDYQSSDINVVSVSSDGLITIAGVGSCEIKIIARDIEGEFYKTIPVTVNSISPSGIANIEVSSLAPMLYPLGSNRYTYYTFNGTSVLAPIGTTQYVATAYDFNGNQVNTSFQWSVGNSSIASVDSLGMVTATGAGNTYVQASAQDVLSNEAMLGIAACNFMTADPGLPDPRIIHCPNEIHLYRGDSTVTNAEVEPKGGQPWPMSLCPNDNGQIIELVAVTGGTKIIAKSTGNALVLFHIGHTDQLVPVYVH